MPKQEFHCTYLDRCVNGVSIASVYSNDDPFPFTQQEDSTKLKLNRYGSEIPVDECVTPKTKKKTRQISAPRIDEE